MVPTVWGIIFLDARFMRLEFEELWFIACLISCVYRSTKHDTTPFTHDMQAAILPVALQSQATVLHQQTKVLQVKSLHGNIATSDPKPFGFLAYSVSATM